MQEALQTFKTSSSPLSMCISGEFSLSAYDPVALWLACMSSDENIKTAQENSQRIYVYIICAPSDELSIFFFKDAPQWWCKIT